MYSKEHYPYGYFWIIASSRSGHMFLRDNITSWVSDEKRFFVNLETIDPEKALSHESFKNTDQKIYSSSIKILNVRDLLNWFISCSFFSIKFKSNAKRIYPPLLENLKWEREMTKYMYYNPNLVIIEDGKSKEEYLENFDFVFNHRLDWDKEKNMKKRLDNWVNITKEYLGYTNYLKDFIKVYYDDFFISEEYRRNICSLIGGKYSEEKLNQIPFSGNHSSFDDHEYHGNAQQMKVLERYKRWESDETNRHLLKLLKDHEALDLYLNNFEVNEDKKRFIDKWIISN